MRFDVLGLGGRDYRSLLLKLRRDVLICMVNPRPAGPMNFPPPAGGGAFERPLHDLGSWSS